MTRFVLDASVSLSWFVDQPVSSYAARVRRYLQADARAVVPALWHLEMANGLALAERRGVLSADDIGQCLRDTERLLAQAIESESGFPAIRQVLTTALDSQLTAYDSVYLDTARHGHLPLATLDRQLRVAAARAGVALVR